MNYPRCGQPAPTAIRVLLEPAIHWMSSLWDFASIFSTSFEPKNEQFEEFSHDPSIASLTALKNVEIRVTLM